MPTLFEKIIAGEVPSTMVYRDSRVVAFLDIRPAAPVHLLIVPHKPIPTTDDIEPSAERGTLSRRIERADNDRNALGTCGSSRERRRPHRDVVRRAQNIR